MNNCFICNHSLVSISVFNPKGKEKLQKSEEELRKISTKFRHYCSQKCADKDNKTEIYSYLVD